MLLIVHADNEEYQTHLDRPWVVDALVRWAPFEFTPFIKSPQLFQNVEYKYPVDLKFWIDSMVITAQSWFQDGKDGRSPKTGREAQHPEAHAYVS
mgnify:CR=1 FL=1